jgi:hypothetical protein
MLGIETVIASQRVGAKRRPMINSAKQSIKQKERMDCFVASLLAMTQKWKYGKQIPCEKTSPGATL